MGCGFKCISGYSPFTRSAFRIYRVGSPNVIRSPAMQCDDSVILIYYIEQLFSFIFDVIYFILYFRNFIFYCVIVLFGIHVSRTFNFKECYTYQNQQKHENKLIYFNRVPT